jgi:hypothetical protein
MDFDFSDRSRFSFLDQRNAMGPRLQSGMDAAPDIARSSRIRGPRRHRKFQAWFLIGDACPSYAQ